MADQGSTHNQSHDLPVITPEILLRAYSAGYFPMAESADSTELFWVEPKERGILPLNGLHLSKSLVKTIRSGKFDVFVDRDFDAVITACAQTRMTTWINSRIHDLYKRLFDLGKVHTVECFHNDQRVGGLYGLAIGRIFFGESMYHLMRDASKVALAHLVARLRAGGFILLDTQFVTPHLASLGALTIPKNHYRHLLQEALIGHADFHVWSMAHQDDPAEIMNVLNSANI
jgi:leucyl/phenylalanyl-tRNA---protein transferase